MAVVCNAIWTVRPGQGEGIGEVLREMTAATRQEPGNLVYQAYRNPERPDEIRIFEVYADEAALTAHSESDHFRRWVLETAAPLLEGRRREMYETVGD